MKKEKTTLGQKRKEPLEIKLNKKKSFEWFNSSKSSKIGLIIILVLTFFLYSPIRNHQFLNYDDDVLVYRNEYVLKIANEGISGMFTKGILLHDPITLLTHAYTIKFYGQNPKPFLTINLILHLFNVLLIFLFFKYLTKEVFLSLIIATIFAFQPIHVESVAWVTERKDVLFSFFLLLGLIFYLKYLDYNNKWYYLLIALFFLVLSLLSKFSAVIFPFIAILIDYWKCRKITKMVIVEKAIFAIPVFAMAIIAFTSNIVIDNNNGVLTEFTFIDRLFFSTYSFTFYTIKSIFPYNLYSFIPYPIKTDGSLPTYYYYSAIAATTILSVFIFAFYKMNKVRKEIIFGLAFYIISISLVLHVIPFGGNVIVADRYTYIASSGLIFAILASIFNLYGNKKISKFWMNTFYIALFAYVIYLFLYSSNKIKTWENSISLFSDVIKKDQTAALAYYNRGLAYSYEKKPELAIQDYDKAIALKPKHVDIYNNRGLLKAEFGDVKGAILDYNKAIEIKPDYINAIVNRSVAYMSLQNYREVINDCNKALEINPSLTAAINNRGLAKDALKDHEGAIIDFTKSLNINPNYPDAYYNRGNSYYYLKKYDEAIENYNSCINLMPNHDKAICNRAFANSNLNKMKEACTDWKTSLELGNKNAENAYNSYCKTIKK